VACAAEYEQLGLPVLLPTLQHQDILPQSTNLQLATFFISLSLYKYFSHSEWRCATPSSLFKYHTK
jgi:hypothetical protein